MLKKKFGQHFIKNESILIRQTKQAYVFDKNVLEIGTGDGRLTKIILNQNPKKLTSIEIDSDLLINIKENIGEDSRLKLIIGDFLKMKPARFDTVFGNVPYYISSKILFHLTKFDFDRAILCFQKEFAKRMLAFPGEKNYSRLSLTTSLFFNVFEKFIVKKGSFQPIPKVDSLVVALEKSDTNEIAKKLEEKDFDLINLIFQHKNKTLYSCIKHMKKEREEKEKMINLLKEKSPNILKTRPRFISKYEMLDLINLLNENNNEDK